MNALVIYAHPNPKSFNAAIAATVCKELEKQGVEVKFKDLYAMNWNPVLTARDFEGYQTGNLPADVQSEQADISRADLVIMVAPVWWVSVPAILKGYIDRVFSNGFAFEYTGAGPKGKLLGKKARLITTSGADEKVAQQGTMVETIRRAAVNSIFGFCGFAEYKYNNFFAVPTASDLERAAMLTEVQHLMQEYF